MTSIILGFEIHQPLRIKHSPGSSDDLHDGQLIDHYFSSNGLNKFVFDRATKKCYSPTTHILLEHIDNFKGQKKEFKCVFNMSGVWLEQCEKWQPDVLELFRQIAKSGRAEFLGSTYFHSIASLFKNHGEFIEQVKMQSRTIKDLLGVKPFGFINTEMLYNNLIAKTVEDLGFKVIFTEGVEKILGWRSPNYVYARGPISDNDKPLNDRIKVLTRNYRLSDDIGYRFSSKSWNEWPLTAEKYSIWLSSTPGQVSTIFMDYETFGEHHPDSSGIFFFLKALPWKVFDWNNLEFALPSEVIQRHSPSDQIDVDENATISWADMERDTSAWLGNSMQKMAFDEIEKLEPIVKQNGRVHLRMWRLLQQSDLLYYMCTKWWQDGDVHKYFSPFSTPHDAFINVVSGISDIKVRLATEMAVLNVLNGKKKEEMFDLKELVNALDTIPSEKTIEKEIEIPKVEKPERKRRAKKEAISTEGTEVGFEVVVPSKVSTIDFILSENVVYPKSQINIENISAVSDVLRRRIR